MSIPKTFCGIALLIGLTICAACSDDGVTPEGFQVDIRVSDPQGDPVAGLNLAVVPDLPFYPDMKAREVRSVVTIPMSVAQASDIRVAILDIEGNEIRMMFDGSVPAGGHHMQWNGADDEGTPMHSGVYAVSLVVRPEGGDVVVLDDRKYMMMAILDFDREIVGTTDALGRIVLDDRRLFPHLFDPPDIPATDEDGDPIGTLQLTPTTRFYLTHPGGGGHMRFDRTVDGSATMVLVWDPTAAAAVAGEPRAASAPALRLQPTQYENMLVQPYPCPFN